MKKINFQTHVLPHLLAVLVFFLMTIIFFNPVFFKNKSIHQEDIQMWAGSAKALLDFRDQTGEEGLWAPSMFCGMPAYLVNVEWSNGPVMTLKRILTLFIPHPVANIFAAFISYYLLLLAFRIRPYLAIAGALAFGLSTFILIGLQAGHNSRIGAIAFMPLVMAGIHLAFSGKKILGTGVTLAGLTLQLRENHIQITYYLLFLVAGYGLLQLIIAIREKTITDYFKTLGLLAFAALLAVGTFIGELWALTEYSAYTIRGNATLTTSAQQKETGLTKSYAFAYSSGIAESMSLLIPDYYGYYTRSEIGALYADKGSETYKALTGVQNEQMAQQLAPYASPYWGPPVAAGPYYAGAIICFLFIAGILYAEKKYVWWLVPLSMLSIVLTWGDNFSGFNYFMFDYFPGYNKFRSVTFAISIALLAMPLLGLRGLENMLKEGWHKGMLKKYLWPVGLTAGLCLLFAFTGGFGDLLRDEEYQLPAWFTNALSADRASILRGDAWRSFWFIILAAGVIYATLKEWINTSVLALILSLLVIFDLALVDNRFFNENNYVRKRGRTAFTPNGADEAIMKDKSYYRVYNLQGTMAEARTSYFHNSIGGYHGAKVRRYQDLYDSCITKQTQQFITDARAGNIDFKKYSAINMLNVRYIIFGPDAGNIIPNPDTNGPAWFVSDVVRANSPVEELSTLCSINTRQTAVVDASSVELPKTQYDSASQITLAHHQPNYMKYESKSQQDGFAVFSEIYYPKGWHAFIDGKEATIVRADYTLRGLMVPAGNHVIEFRFTPEAYRIGNTAMAISSWLMALIVLGSIGWSLKEEKK